MSEILDRLKQAEAERERVIAERRRLEAEADAALAAREREEARRLGGQPPPAVQPVAPAPRPAPRRSWGALLVATLALAAGYAAGLRNGPAPPSARAPAAPAPAAAPVEATPAGDPLPLKLDADLPSFSARLAGSGK